MLFCRERCQQREKCDNKVNAEKTGKQYLDVLVITIDVFISQAMWWLSSLFGERSNGGINRNLSDMDDLMCMADGQYEDDVDPIISDPEPVFSASHDLPLASDSALNSRSGSQSKITFPKSRLHLTLISILVTVLFVGVSIGLGCYSLFMEADLVIDKTIKSFSIPNHQAYLNFEALNLARLNATGQRSKRSVSNSNREQKYESSNSNNFMKSLPETYEDPSLFPSVRGKFSTLLDFTSRRVRRAAHDIRCLFDTERQVQTKWRMHVIYLADGDGENNIFTKERIETVHEIEKKIIQQPRFQVSYSLHL